MVLRANDTETLLSLLSAIVIGASSATQSA